MHPTPRDDRDTRVLLAVVKLERPTMRRIAADARCSLSAAYDALGRLRELGLVDWTDGQKGTLRALVKVEEIKWPTAT